MPTAILAAFAGFLFISLAKLGGTIILVRGSEEAASRGPGRRQNAAVVARDAGGLVGKAREGLSEANAALFERLEHVLPRASRRIAKELDLTKEDLGQAMRVAEQAD